MTGQKKNAQGLITTDRRISQDLLKSKLIDLMSEWESLSAKRTTIREQIDSLSYDECVAKINESLKLIRADEATKKRNLEESDRYKSRQAPGTVQLAIEQNGNDYQEFLDFRENKRQSLDLANSVFIPLSHNCHNCGSSEHYARNCDKPLVQYQQKSQMPMRGGGYGMHNDARGRGVQVEQGTGRAGYGQQGTQYEHRGVGRGAPAGYYPYVQLDPRNTGRMGYGQYESPSFIGRGNTVGQGVSGQSFRAGGRAEAAGRGVSNRLIYQSVEPPGRSASQQHDIRGGGRGANLGRGGSRGGGFRPPYRTPYQNFDQSGTGYRAHVAQYEEEYQVEDYGCDFTDNHMEEQEYIANNGQFLEGQNQVEGDNGQNNGYKM